jgi:hypothetical protein
MSQIRQLEGDMQKASWIGLRLLGVLALAAVVHTTSLTLAPAAAGRDYPRCVQTCNELRRSCEGRCDVDCNDMFPDDRTARQACLSTCKGQCGDEASDCKLVCLQDKKDNSPIEP